MKAPLYVRALSPAEQAGVEAGLRVSNAFTLRQSQILLASHRDQRPSVIARNLGCATQTVRNTLHAFEQSGLACLKPQPSRPKTIHAEFDQEKCEALRSLLHESPRAYSKDTSVWTLALAAQVCQERGLTTHQVSIETIRMALKRLGMGWQRAKHWITSPDPDYARKKKRRDALIALAQRRGWAVRYLDEVWWSRVAQPDLHAWSESKQPLQKQQSEGCKNQRQELWEQAHALHEQGYGVRTIAKLLGLARNTVRSYLTMKDGGQSAAPAKRRSLLDPYRDYLLTRWMQGEHNGNQLTREIRSQGYQGCDTLAREAITSMRKTYPEVVALPRKHPTSQTTPALPHLTPKSSPRQLRWLLAKKREELREEEQVDLSCVLEGSEEVRLVYRLLQAFLQMMRERQAESLLEWMRRSTVEWDQGTAKFCRRN